MNLQRQSDRKYKDKISTYYDYLELSLSLYLVVGLSDRQSRMTKTILARVVLEPNRRTCMSTTFYLELGRWSSPEALRRRDRYETHGFVEKSMPGCNEVG